MTSSLKIGVIGVGAMGVLHARTVANCPETELVWVCDKNQVAGEMAARRFESNWIREPDLGVVDAVVVSVPTQFHYQIAIEVVSSGVPLLVEKPLATSFTEISEIVQQSRRSSVPLMCGLLERFNPAVRTAFELVREPIHLKTVRHSPLTPRITTGVAGDLLIHDIDLAIRLFNEPPTFALGCRDQDHEVGRSPEDIAECLLKFDDRRIASLSASRRSQRKIRTMSISEPDRLVEIDLLRQDITIYRHVLESSSDDEMGYRQQTIIDIPVVKFPGEPLMLQLERFCRLVRGDEDPDSERESIIPPHEVVANLFPESRPS